MSIKLKHLGLLAVLLATVVLVVAIAALRHGFSARDKPSALETLLAKTARSLAVPSRAKRLANPVPNTLEHLAQAEAHWADHCATCHANNGSGDTDIGRNLYPRAPDMRLQDTQKLTDGELYYTIENGIRLTGMPAWGDGSEHDEDGWKLVLLIRHLPQLTPAEEKAMERMNPKGPEQRREEKEEEKFLKGGEPPPAKPPSRPHHH